MSDVSALGKITLPGVASTNSPMRIGINKSSGHWVAAYVSGANTITVAKWDGTSFTINCPGGIYPWASANHQLELDIAMDINDNFVVVYVTSVAKREDMIGT